MFVVTDFTTSEQNPVGQKVFGGERRREVMIEGFPSLMALEVTQELLVDENEWTANPQRKLWMDEWVEA